MTAPPLTPCAYAAPAVRAPDAERTCHDSAVPALFSPLRIAGITVPNRILSSGHDTVLAGDGAVTDELIACHEARAAGGVGLIVLQVSGVHESARYTTHVLMATEDECVPGYARLAQAVHRHGTKIFGQLFHSDTVYLQHTLTEEPVLLEGTAGVVLAQGHIPVDDLDPVALGVPADRVFAVGDRVTPRTVEEAVLEGLTVASDLRKRSVDQSPAPDPGSPSAPARRASPGGPGDDRVTPAPRPHGAPRCLSGASGRAGRRQARWFGSFLVGHTILANGRRPVRRRWCTTSRCRSNSRPRDLTAAG
ncbi:oxidoreductase [Streptomyces sp. NPDC002867]